MCQQVDDLKYSLLTDGECPFTCIHSYRLICIHSYNLYLLHDVLITFLSFQVVTTGNPVLDYETMPKSFDLQIFVEDTMGRTDVNILTVRITDKNEHPVFRGNMAIQSKIMVVFEKDNT